MTLGPIVAGLGLLLLTRVGLGSTYVRDVLPAVAVFGLGLSLTVAPLTSTVLAAIGDEQAGVASAVNNAVSRVAGLIAVATLPVAAGLSTDAFSQPAELATGFHSAMWITAGMCVAGGLVAAVTIQNPRRAAPVASAPIHHCGVDATPLRCVRSLSS